MSIPGVILSQFEMQTSASTHTARLLDFARNELTEVFEMDMARHELGKRINNSDNRLAEVGVAHAGGSPQTSRTGHVAPVGCRSGAILRHWLAFRSCALGFRQRVTTGTPTKV
jgi:hypothetical protein